MNEILLVNETSLQTSFILHYPTDMQKLCQSSEILDCLKFSKKIGAWEWAREKACCQIDSNLLRFRFSRLDSADWIQVILRFKCPILTWLEKANERSSTTRKLCDEDA